MQSISQADLGGSNSPLMRDLWRGGDVLVTADGHPLGILRMTPLPNNELPERFVSAERAQRLHKEAPLSPAQRNMLLAEIQVPTSAVDVTGRNDMLVEALETLYAIMGRVTARLSDCQGDDEVRPLLRRLADNVS